MRLSRLIGLFILAALLAAGGAAGWLVWDYRAPRDLGEGTLVRVAPGASGRRVAEQLAGIGLGSGAERLYWGLRLITRPDTLKAGVYRFSGQVSPARAVEAIARGQVDLVTVTLPEGLTARQMADELARAGVLADPAPFAALALDGSAAARYALPGPGLEGFLYPDTYKFARELSADAVAGVLAARFREVARQIDPDAFGDPERLLGWVTLASIVEKESGHPDERPVIASVFANRLRLGMRLETDPTVIYGLADFDGNIRKADLSDPHPYNTYVHRGLPPGPIANPGAESLRAALHPPETGYLYFVSRGDGTHQFSERYEDHARAVRRYQLGGRP